MQIHRKYFYKIILTEKHISFNINLSKPSRSQSPSATTLTLRSFRPAQRRWLHARYAVSSTHLHKTFQAGEFFIFIIFLHKNFVFHGCSIYAFRLFISKFPRFFPAFPQWQVVYRYGKQAVSLISPDFQTIYQQFHCHLNMQ